MTPGQIKFFRVTQGLRQYELAERIGVSQGRICALERGHGKPPTSKELTALRYALSIPAPEEAEACDAT